MSGVQKTRCTGANVRGQMSGAKCPGAKNQGQKTRGQMSGANFRGGKCRGGGGGDVRFPKDRSLWNSMCFIFLYSESNPYTEVIKPFNGNSINSI